jgi:hypothetical protein
MWASTYLILTRAIVYIISVSLSISTLARSISISNQIRKMKYSMTIELGRFLIAANRPRSLESLSMRYSNQCWMNVRKSYKRLYGGSIELCRRCKNIGVIAHIVLLSHKKRLITIKLGEYSEHKISFALSKRNPRKTFQNTQIKNLHNITKVRKLGTSRRSTMSTTFCIVLLVATFIHSWIMAPSSVRTWCEQ